MSAQPLRRQPRRLRNVDVRRIPAVHLHAKRGVRVFGHRLDRDAANLVQRRSPHHGAGAAEERRVPEVVAILHNAVEQLALVRDHAKLPQVPLKRIGRVKMMRRLQHAQLAVAQKPAHRHLQKAARRHVVANRRWPQRAQSSRLQRAIDVARLGMLVIVARHVPDAGFFRERAELLPLAIIQDVDIQLVRRPVDIHRGQRRIPHHVQRLVVGRDQQVDRGPHIRVFRQAAPVFGAAARASAGIRETE